MERYISYSLILRLVQQKYYRSKRKTVTTIMHSFHNLKEEFERKRFLSEWSSTPKKEEKNGRIFDRPVAWPVEFGDIKEENCLYDRIPFKLKEVFEKKFSPWVFHTKVSHQKNKKKMVVYLIGRSRTLWNFGVFLFDQKEKLSLRSYSSQLERNSRISFLWVFRRKLSEEKKEKNWSYIWSLVACPVEFGDMKGP